MKPQSNLFRIFAVLLALLLVGAYVFDRSGGDLKAAVGLDRVFARDAQVEALNQRIERLEGKLDLLLNASGIPVGTSSDTVGDPFAASPPGTAPSPALMYSTKSAAVFLPDPSGLPTVTPVAPQPNASQPTTAPELMPGSKSLVPVFAVPPTPPIAAPSPTPPTAAPTNTGNTYPNQEPAQQRANAPANPPAPTFLPGSKSERIFTPPVQQSQSVQQPANRNLP